MAGIEEVRNGISRAMALNGETRQDELAVADRLERIGAAVGLVVGQLAASLQAMESLGTRMREAHYVLVEVDGGRMATEQTFAAAMSGANQTDIDAVQGALGQAHHHEVNGTRAARGMNARLGGAYRQLRDVIAILSEGEGDTLPDWQAVAVGELRAAAGVREAADIAAESYLARIEGA